ncbi:hypothetical protein Mmol_1759 [Methylotenera mobilis JLW8]|uniref:Uncharacterized protein n=1 Tax=Methylotenera mobilis (strain JLW8 / ATCC BAA-1282 / DSM 17540) TaxID=583345 RepID=C6WXL4_METML|nr:hypothetical protein Mmol_1759 [Methylotenera mobilis JLW8]
MTIDYQPNFQVNEEAFTRPSFALKALGSVLDPTLAKLSVQVK